MRGASIAAAALGGALAIATIIGFWLWRAAPVAMPDAPGNGRMACLSYTPFRGDQTPFDQSLVIPAAQIEEDLARLKSETDCVRIYAVNQGLDQVLPIAEKAGLKVLMGLWIGISAADNEIQIARGIELARAHPATIKGIIVGNEVLLRREQTAETLAALLQRVKSETGLPVTYADVWEFWLRHPELADKVDFVTIHVLPYWEDDPVPAADGVIHIDAILQRVHAAMPGKTIYIGETGYPSAGKQREQAVPGLIEQATFIRGFLDYAGRNQLDYNIIEAFDQPWKRALEGTVGGYWGVFDEARTPKFPLRGPVVRTPLPWPWVVGTLALAAVIVWPARTSARSAAGAFFAPMLATGAALAIALQVEHARYAALQWSEWLVEGALVALSIAVAMLGLPRILSGTGAIAPAEPSLAWLRRPWRTTPDAALMLGALQLIAIASAMVVAFGLDFDPRYRDFPIWGFAVPAVVFTLLRLRTPSVTRAGAIEICFAVLLAISAVFIALNENTFTRPEFKESVIAAFRPMLAGVINGNALIWCAMLLVFAFSWATFNPRASTQL